MATYSPVSGQLDAHRANRAVFSRGFCYLLTTPISAGTRLSPYEIAGTIGAGGMGEVYRAHDTRLGRDVAVKVLPTAFADTPAQRRC